MFKFFKWIKEKRLAKLRAQKEQLKNEFVSYVNAYKDQNSTMEAMYLLIHGLELNINILLEKYNLIVDFDYFELDDYYEIQIYSSLDSENEFYIAIGTEEGKNTLLLQDDSEADADSFTTNEIIDKIIEQIESYHDKEQ